MLRGFWAVFLILSSEFWILKIKICRIAWFPRWPLTRQRLVEINHRGWESTKEKGTTK